MKLIFLDFDGVLVTRRSLKERSGRRAVADAACVTALNRITATTDAKIVVSSAWRFCGENELRAILELWKVEAPMVGITPDLSRISGKIYTAVPRGHEIQRWMDENAFDGPFVIIDDDADMVHLSCKLIRTEFESGLTEAQANQAIAMLGCVSH